LSLSFSFLDYSPRISGLFTDDYYCRDRLLLGAHRPDRRRA
jgi:hypothetical protein